MTKSTSGWASREALNYSGVNEDGPPPLPRAIYAVKIVEAEPVQSSNGNPCVKFVVEASSALDGSDISSCYKRAYSTTAVTGKNLFRVLQIASALGIDPPADSGFDTLTAFCEEMLGKECYARIYPREYEGRVSNNLDRLMDETKAASEAGGSDAEAAPAEVTPMRRGRRAAAAE